MRLKLTVLVIGMGLLLWTRVGAAGVGIDVITGDPVITHDGPSPQQEKREQEKHEWERQDRQDKKQKEETAEKAAVENSRGAAYRQAKAEHRAKVKRLRGKKSVSWQLNH